MSMPGTPPSRCQRACSPRRLSAVWLWLLVPAALLLMIQLVVLAWVMRPLKRLAREVREIEHGQGERIDGDYPRELQSLRSALNTLLGQERSRQQRYRQALDDLAHSLKTPLAVIRNLVIKRDSAVTEASPLAKGQDEREDVGSSESEESSED